MKKLVLQNCAIAVFGLAATLTTASAQETPGIQGVWFADVTPVNCQTGAAIPGAVPFRSLSMFIHDGSLTNESAFLVASPRRSSGLGAWQHTQGQTYTATFRFFRYNPDGSLQVIRRVAQTIFLKGDQFTSIDTFQDFDANSNPLSTAGCNIETATRVQ